MGTDFLKKVFFSGEKRGMIRGGKSVRKMEAFPMNNNEMLLLKLGEVVLKGQNRR